MLQLIVGAISGTATGAAGAITANWADISFSAATGSSGTSSSSVVFTGGGNRTLLFQHNVVSGTLSVSLDGVNYTNISSGYTMDVPTGVTVYLKYSCYYVSESATLTITDNTLASLIDTVTLTFTRTGTGGGGHGGYIYA